MRRSSAALLLLCALAAGAGARQAHARHHDDGSFEFDCYVTGECVLCPDTDAEEYDKACKATGHHQAIDCRLTGPSSDDLDAAAKVVNKLRVKWQPFATAAAPPGGDVTAHLPPGHGHGGVAPAEAAALLSDEAALAGGIRRLQGVALRGAPAQRAGAGVEEGQYSESSRAVLASDSSSAVATRSPAALGASAAAEFRLLHTHQRCAPPHPDSALGVLCFEAAAVVAGSAAGGFIVWRKRRAAQRSGLPRAPGTLLSGCL